MGLIMRVLFISLGLYGSDLDEDIKKLNVSHLTIADETLYFFFQAVSCCIIKYNRGRKY